MFTRLKVAWWALLGRPIVYRVNLGLNNTGVCYDKRHGPLCLAECVLAGPPAPFK